MTSKDYEDSSAEESSFLDTHLQLLPKGGGLDRYILCSFLMCLRVLVGIMVSYIYEIKA